MEPDDLDGCDLAFDDPTTNTADEDADALVMFAGVDWTDGLAVHEQRRALIEWDLATRGEI
jgi:hypothetical protein